MANRAIIGERPPSYVSKTTLAAELDVSESTIDSYVGKGILPKPHKLGGSTRWCWAEVDASIGSQASSQAVDPYIEGLKNA